MVLVCIFGDNTVRCIEYRIMFLGHEMGTIYDIGLQKYNHADTWLQRHIWVIARSWTLVAKFMLAPEKLNLRVNLKSDLDCNYQWEPKADLVKHPKRYLMDSASWLMHITHSPREHLNSIHHHEHTCGEHAAAHCVPMPQCSTCSNVCSRTKKPVWAHLQKHSAHRA